MSKDHKPRMPRINNSGIDRSPNNVYLVIDGDPREPFQVHFYETELQGMAEEFPDWNLFVKENV